jgi:hypothetical protein
MAEKPKRPIGLYRTRGLKGMPNTVRVQDVGGIEMEMDIPEQRYRDNGYEPPYEQLPWRGEPNA